MHHLGDRHFFSDSDGLVYDFERGFKEQFGLDWNTTPPNKAWPLIYRTPEFYFNLPLMADAMEYWEIVAPHKPTVLTGAPTAGFAAAADAKRRAWKRDFGEDVPVIVCHSKDKPLHMRRPGDFLADDHKKNTDRWEQYGGTGILYKNAKQFKEDFHALLEVHIEVAIKE